MTVADRQKLFATRLGDDDEGDEQAKPQESKFGITVHAITPDIADRMKLPNSKGVIVQDVKPDGFGDSVGVSRGDVILEINKQPVNSEDDFRKLESLAQVRAGRCLPGQTAGSGTERRNRFHGRNASVTEHSEPDLRTKRASRRSQSPPGYAIRPGSIPPAGVSFRDCASFFLFPIRLTGSYNCRVIPEFIDFPPRCQVCA